MQPVSKVLITGISGFIGENLALNLVKKGYEVHGVDINRRQNSPFDVEIVDLTRPINELPAYDLLIHLAGNADVAQSYANPLYDFNNNVTGTLNLLEYNRKHGNHPVIFASSYRVYPVQEAGGPRSIYGCSKLACELYLTEYHHSFGTPIVINRLSCIFGEGQKPNKQGWVTLFLYSKIKGDPVEISGDGRQVRDCLYIGDLVRLIELQIKNLDACNGNIYNIGGGATNAFSLMELVEFLDREYPQYKPLCSNIKKIPEGKAFRVYISDLSDIRWLWVPEISTWDGIRRTFKWIEME